MRRTILLAATVIFVWGCSDDSSTVDTGTGVDLAADIGMTDKGGGDNGTADKSTADKGAADTSIVDAPPSGVAVDVQLGLHGNEVKIKLDTMTVLGKEATDFDLYMNHDDGPNMYMGPGVTGQNLGAAQAFHDVTAAPDTGYEADAPPNLIIGTSWRNGGAGTTGWIMTKNIYALKLADSTYAKIEVLSAKSGEVHVLCYRQADGSKDLTTTP